MIDPKEVRNRIEAEISNRQIELWEAEKMVLRLTAEMTGLRHALHHLDKANK